MRDKSPQIPLPFPENDQLPKKGLEADVDNTSFSQGEDFIIYPEETGPFVDENMPLFPLDEVTTIHPKKMLPEKSNLEPSQQTRKPLQLNIDRGCLLNGLAGNCATSLITIFVKRPVERRVTQKVQ